MNDKTPRIRFKGFIDDWAQRKLGDIVGIYDGVHQTPNYQNSGVMFLSVENIATLKSSKFISEEDFKRDYKVFPQENDILMTRIGDVGTTNVVTDNGLKAFYVSLALLKYKSTDPYFLSNAIQSDYVQKGLANRTLKTAIPMKINKDEIGKVSVMLPVSATEQQQIGTYFHNLDNLITLHQRKYDQLLNIKKSMLEKMFPKNGKKAPEIRFNGFTDDWEQRKFSEGVSEIGDGLHGTPIYCEDGNVYFINGNNLVDGKIVISAETKKVNESQQSTADKSLDDTTILMSINGTIGNLAYYSGERLMLGKSAAYIKVSEFDKRFVYAYLQAPSVQGYFMDSLTGTTIKNLGLKAIREMIMFIPQDVDEQKRIGRFFDYLDNLITLHQRKLEKLENLKKSMLKQMFL